MLFQCGSLSAGGNDTMGLSLEPCSYCDDNTHSWKTKMVCLPGEPGQVLPAQIFPSYPVSLEMWHWRYPRLFVFVNCLVSDTCLKSSLAFLDEGGALYMTLIFTCSLDRYHLLVWTPLNQLLWSQPVVSLVRKEASCSGRGPSTLSNIPSPSISCLFHKWLPRTPNVPTNDWDFWSPILI